MTLSRAVRLAGLSLAAAGCSQTVSTPINRPPVPKLGAPAAIGKPAVAALLKSFETGDKEPMSVIAQDKYTQHNLAVADGAGGIAALLAQLPKGSVKVETVRLLEDGEFVVAHNNYEMMGPKVGFDVYRFANNKIVEHWDNLQERPKQANPSGHTMTDGPTEVADPGHTAANKALVQQFVETVLIAGKLDGLDAYLHGDDYIQHDPHVGDGVKALKEAAQDPTKQHLTVKYTKLHKVLGEGNFVLAMSEGMNNGQAAGIYDLFRVEGAKIAEHWDVVQPVPPRGEWKNQNGKF